MDATWCEIIGPSLLNKIMRDVELEAEEFNELLKSRLPIEVVDLITKRGKIDGTEKRGGDRHDVSL